MSQLPLGQPDELLLYNFNYSLRELKEEFHKTGRYDDANTKLDEILKLLVVKYFDLKNNIDSLSINYLENIAYTNFGDKKSIAKALQFVFSKVAQDKIFLNRDGSNIFGSNPHLNIQASDDGFAIKILKVINSIESSNLDTKNKDFDILNEAFGHFVRDNFRNHKEDAQYMTPSEVVNAAIEIAFKDILKDKESLKNTLSVKKDSFIVLDPTCGVGSFLLYAYKKMVGVVNSLNVKSKDYLIEIKRNSAFVGQDKVDRMVRMSKINYLLSGLNPILIEQGNSIIGDSVIDKYIGKVDLILTNPPFGAEFNVEEIIKQGDKYEFLKDIKKYSNVKTLYSELIMLDRCLKLLKPGGRLLIIVPDGIVSSKGMNEVYRDILSTRYILKAVIDLPSVTFAQAGTRTRCSILYIQKPYESKFEQDGIFMAAANDIGFEVKEKVGTATKIYSGTNELEKIVELYNPDKQSNSINVLSAKPSVVIYPFNQIINGKWNANFYNASRLDTISKFQNVNNDEFEILPLKQIAEFRTKNRKKKMVTETVKHISILHINEDSTIKLEEVMQYNPISPGRECFPGDILFSKINPRIPRITVVPGVQINLTCSSEFEIIKPYQDEYTYLLKTFLLTDIVLKQVVSLTSGTSSSHNRIKDTELMDIKIPWPKKGTESEKKLLEIAKNIKEYEERKYSANRNIKSLYEDLYSWVGI